MPKNGILIGIAGGSGSGKTLVSNTVLSLLGSDRILIIEQDSYYRDLSHLNIEERLKNGEKIYRVSAHSRLAIGREVRYVSETRASDLVTLSFRERRFQAGQMISEVRVALEGDSYSVVRLLDEVVRQR